MLNDRNNEIPFDIEFTYDSDKIKFEKNDELLADDKPVELKEDQYEKFVENIEESEDEELFENNEEESEETDENLGLEEDQDENLFAEEEDLLESNNMNRDQEYENFISEDMEQILEDNNMQESADNYYEDDLLDLEIEENKEESIMEASDNKLLKNMKIETDDDFVLEDKTELDLIDDDEDEFDYDYALLDDIDDELDSLLDSDYDEDEIKEFEFEDEEEELNKELDNGEDENFDDLTTDECKCYNEDYNETHKTENNKLIENIFSYGFDYENEFDYEGNISNAENYFIKKESENIDEEEFETIYSEENNLLFDNLLENNLLVEEIEEEKFDDENLEEIDESNNIEEEDEEEMESVADQPEIIELDNIDEYEEDFSESGLSKEFLNLLNIENQVISYIQTEQIDLYNIVVGTSPEALLIENVFIEPLVFKKASELDNIFEFVSNPFNTFEFDKEPAEILSIIDDRIYIVTKNEAYELDIVNKKITKLNDIDMSKIADHVVSPVKVIEILAKF